MSFRTQVFPHLAPLAVAVLMALVFNDAFAADLASDGKLPNNVPILNPSGAAATYSTEGFVDLNNAFHTRQGNNGRTCESCHMPTAGWSINPLDVELRFLLTGGRDPLFNVLDANSPTAQPKTLAQKYAAYSMLRKGLFRRGGDIPENDETDFHIVKVDDPLNTGASLKRVQAFRRPLATANFHIAQNVGWHDQNTNGTGDVHAGLVAQASGAFSGALGGPAAPAEVVDSVVRYEQGLRFAQTYVFGVGALDSCGARGGPAAPAEVVDSVVRYEQGLRFAQTYVFGVGALDSCGARGGPQHLSDEAPVAGRFDLFDAWIDLVPGSCTTKAADRKRAQIARGQEIFNNGDANGKTCLGCHNAKNNGSNVNGALFDIGASREKFRKPGMPLYTLVNDDTGEERKSTDPGRAIRTGKWVDIDKFKTPSLRGVAARAPYFHNGIAPTLNDVVKHYEVALGFKFTKQEREDLVAFLEAL
jgi:cytochrome c peroxidase